MNPLHSDDINNDETEEKPLLRSILVNNNNKESYENWFVDTFIRIVLLFFASIIFVPLFTIGIFLSFRNCNCYTNLISIHWLLFCSGLKTLIGYIIIVLRLYAESVISEVSYSTITRLRILKKIHIAFEIFYNTFIVYVISNSKLSNCDTIPFFYVIIYLILNFFGCFYVCNLYLVKN